MEFALMLHKQDKRVDVAWQSREVDISDDDDSCADQVVYNEDHLSNLFGLYNRSQKDLQQGPLQRKILEQEVERLPKEQISPPVPSARETAVWDALEGAYIYFREAGQFVHYESDRHRSTGGPESDIEEWKPDVCLEGGTSQNFDYVSIAVGKQQRTSVTEDSYGVSEKKVDARDHLLQVAQARAKLDDIHSQDLGISSTRPKSYCLPKRHKGSYKKKLKFNFQSKSKASSAQASFVALCDENQNVSLAQRLQSLAESDRLQLSKEGGGLKCVVSRTSIPIVEQLLELVQRDSHVSSLQKARNNADHQKVKNTFQTVVDEEIVDEGGIISVSEDKDCHEVAAPLAEPPSETMNEQFQKALLAAPASSEDFNRYEKQKGSVYGFAARLQKVLEQEKMDRLHFMKMLQTNHDLQDYTYCLEVQIKAKTLEARLAACMCKVVKSPQDWQLKEDASGEVHYPLVMVLFNMQTNAYLELEVGHVIRIYPPWQELLDDATQYSKIILCTYFSEFRDTLQTTLSL